MKAPFPWFGGKRRVADVVWAALGDVDNYVEPFAGSLAVLLERPSSHRGQVETVNDADRFLANFWRAVTADPEAVARFADWPVSEADLEARHLWLVNTGRERLDAMFEDPEFFDPKVAGWWVWGINSWIGSGWCSGTGPHKLSEEPSKRPHLGDAGQGINRQLPHLGDAGQGINRKLPHLGNAGQGINRQRPHLGDAGQGINRKLPHLGNAGQGIETYFLELADRLRRVRVINGDWARVVTRGALAYGATVGIFFDPPYLGDVRTSDLYSVDDHHIANEVRDWCIANGDNPRYRIVLAGYLPEHDELIPSTWARHQWSASASYSTTAGGGKNSENRHLECLWLSPGCNRSLTLFDIA